MATAFNPVGFDWTQGVQNVGGTVFAPRFDFAYLRDDAGNLILDETGNPVRTMTGEGESSQYAQGPTTQFVRYSEAEKKPGGFYEVYDTAGNLIGYEPFTAEDFGRGGFFEDILSQARGTATELAPLAAFALTAGGAGGLLGSTLTGGALSGTAAKALGNALISGGAGALTGQDPLKAALLAAGGTFAGSLFGGPSTSTLTDAQFVAADAAQLAAQGLGADQIEQVLRASGVNAAAAIGAADAASAGKSVTDIAQDISVGSRGNLFTDTTKTTTPATVTTGPSGLQTVTTTAAAPTTNIGGLLTAIPSAVTPGGNIVSTTMAPLDQPSQITVIGERAPESNLGGILASIDSSLIGPGVGPQPQVIDVAGTKAPTTPPEDLTAALTTTLGFNPFGPDVGPQPQVIDITGTKKPSTITEDLGAIVTTPVITPPGQVTATPPTDTTKKPTDSDTSLLGTLTLADILKVLAGVSSLGMLNGGGTGGGRTTTSLTPTTPVPVGNADYYNAVQQYYNTFMPQTPRNVATPLQQWYEGKFGG